MTEVTHERNRLLFPGPVPSGQCLDLRFGAWHHVIMIDSIIDRDIRPGLTVY